MDQVVACAEVGQETVVSVVLLHESVALEQEDVVPAAVLDQYLLACPDSLGCNDVVVQI